MSNESKYRSVTNELVSIIKESVENGTALPWRRTWTNRGVASLPFNYTTMNAYNGINRVVLWCAASKRGYSSMGWLTMKQVNDLGGSVIKGEKSTRCIYVKPIFETDEVNEKDDDSEQGVKRTLVKFYNLFNTEQCVGLAAGSEVVCKTGSIDFDSILDNYQGQSGITYVFGTDQPAYRPSSDVVTMPLSETFQCNDDFIAVFAHELVHSTGHKDRLNRAFMNDSTFTHKDLAMEELVAELGSAFLCTELNIVTNVQNHASYLKSWLKALEDDEKFIFKAAAAAQKAVSFLSQYSGSVESTEHDVQTAL